MDLQLFKYNGHKHLAQILLLTIEIKVENIDDLLLFNLNLNQKINIKIINA